MSSIKDSILKLKRYVKSIYKLVLLNMFISMITGVISSAPILLIKRLFDKGLIGRSEKDIIYASLAMIGLAVFSGIFIYLNAVLSGRVSTVIYKLVVDDLHAKILTLDMKYFSDSKIGDIMSRFSNDATMINGIVLNVFQMVLYAFTALFYLAVAIKTDWKLSLGVTLVAPVILFIVKRYSTRLKQAGKNRQEISGELNSKLQETISGIRVIKSFTTETYEKSKFKNITSRLKLYTQKGINYDAKATSMSESLNYILIALMLFFGGFRIVRSSGSFTAGEFMTLIGSIAALYTPVKRGLKLYNNITTNLASIDRIFEILEIDSKIYDKENAIEFTEFKNDIIFKDVNFSYDTGDRVVKSLNLEIKKGEKIALVGNSGGGKSTVVNLIPRFYDVSDGSIKIDGIDLRDYKITSLRKKIGIVPQDTFLFSGSVEDNIKYGNRQATYEDIVEAAKKANAHEFIEKLPNKYDEEIGERGVKLSGGQKQRIAIARAILENPEILILDEATSALDNESEQLVQNALERLMKDKTSFVIAHRLSTIINCDKIIVLQSGEVKEMGTHQELMDLNGIYKSLYERNFDDNQQS